MRKRDGLLRSSRKRRMTDEITCCVDIEELRFGTLRVVAFKFHFTVHFPSKMNLLLKQLKYQVNKSKLARQRSSQPSTYSEHLLESIVSEHTKKALFIKFPLNLTNETNLPIMNRFEWSMNFPVFSSQLIPSTSTMRNVVLTSAIFSIIAFSSEFDVDEFLQTHCNEETLQNSIYKSQEPEVELWCQNFNLTKTEMETIQRDDFVISDKRSILFSDGDIGYLNENFFSKFPNALIMDFMNVTLDMTSPSNIISSKKHPLHTLTFYDHCKISNNRGTHALRLLTELEHFFTYRIDVEFKIIDAKLFQGNRKLRVLSVMNGGFEDIEDGVLESLVNLEQVELVMNLLKLPDDFLETKNKLKRFSLSGNVSLKDKRGFPFFRGCTDLEILILNENVIKHIDRYTFHHMWHLKALFLERNGIENFDLDTFDDLENLQRLSLNGNKLDYISMRHFTNLKKLNYLDLRHNFIKSCDLMKLEFLFFYPQNVKNVTKKWF